MLFFFAKTENYSIFAKDYPKQDIIYPDSLEQVIGFYKVQDMLFEHLFIIYIKTKLQRV